MVNYGSLDEKKEREREREVKTINDKVPEEILLFACV